jgi:dihydroorotase-like cyclic amidohydrolase
MNTSSKQVDLVIRGAKLVSPDQIIEASVAISGEFIVAVGHGDLMPPARQEMRADGFYLLPDAIDSHVHFRDPGYPNKETWKTGSAAAACGGVSTVFEMPNTNPPIGLLRHHENLTADGRASLKILLPANKRLNTAYLLNESFGQLWSYQ